MDLHDDILTYDLIEQYAAGEPIEALASANGMSVNTLRSRMRAVSEDKYQGAKDKNRIARIDRTTARYKRGRNVLLDDIIAALDDPEVLSSISYKDKMAMLKQLGDRVALREGKATERQEVQGQVVQIVTFEDVNVDTE